MSFKSLFVNTTGTHHSKHTAVFLLFLFLFFIAFCGSGVSATRQHDSHVHGVGELDIALDKNDLILELRSPAANIVGFEHAPKTDKQKQAVHDAVEKLQNAEMLFILSEKAGCNIHETHVDNDMAHDSHDAHEEHDSHDKHDSHAAHEKHDSHDHGHKEAHSGEEHGEDSSHSEFEAKYHFKCNSPDRLKSIDVQLFAIFPGFEEIEVQLLTPKYQTAVELTAKNNRITIK